ADFGATNQNIAFQLISQTGGLVGSRVYLLGQVGGSPVAAFDGTNYLMVWRSGSTADTQNDIIGQFVGRSGALVGSTIFVSTVAGRKDLSVPGSLLFDGTNYLVVWRDDRVSNDPNIYGQLITTVGSLLGGEIAITTQGDEQREAVASFDGSNYLIVWLSRQSGPAEQW